MAPEPTATLDNMTFDWSAAEICAIENGADCTACEG
jgi:hypothetical protein